MIFYLQEIRLWSIITGVDFSEVQEFIKSVSKEDGTVDIIVKSVKLIMFIWKPTYAIVRVTITYRSASR